MPTTPTTVSDFIYLASQSPRRRQLLEQIGVQHQPLLPDPGEDAEALETVQAGEAPSRYVQRVTGLKLDAAVARLKARGLRAAPVLCADTTVALGRDILGKPQEAAEARAMLEMSYLRRQAELNALNPWDRYGTYWDGAEWHDMTVA